MSVTALYKLIIRNIVSENICGKFQSESLINDIWNADRKMSHDTISYEFIFEMEAYSWHVNTSRIIHGNDECG